MADVDKARKDDKASGMTKRWRLYRRGRWINARGAIAIASSCGVP